MCDHNGGTNYDVIDREQIEICAMFGALFWSLENFSVAQFSYCSKYSTPIFILSRFYYLP